MGASHRLGGGLVLKPVGISEASEIVGVPIHTLRYWEREFDGFLKPGRTEGQQRRYGAEDIAMLRRIKTLLKEEMFSIAGAKRALARATE